MTLIATGSEVEIAVAAADELAAEWATAAVVSAPSFELFADQPENYRRAMPGTAPRIGIEAAIRQGWDAVLRRKDSFAGMTGFGASWATRTGANVSSEFNHDSQSSIFLMDQTKVMEGMMCRILRWYDNEWGFFSRMSDTGVAMEALL